MEEYCYGNDAKNSQEKACTDYEEAFWGDHPASQGVVMHKHMTAMKAMRKQVSLMGKVETANESSNFAGVIVGTAAGMVVGAAGAIIAARSCTYKTDDAFARV